MHKFWCLDQGIFKGFFYPSPPQPGFSKLQEVGICVNRELNISDFLEKQAIERFELVS